MKSSNHSQKIIKAPKSIYQYSLEAALMAALLILVPLTAMMFTNEITWSLVDFIVAWLLFFGAGFSYRLIARKSINLTYKAATSIAVGTTLLLIWINLAVGFIGNENNPANLMYAVVIAVGLISALLVRFHPLRMARALFNTALAQAIVVMIVFITDLHYSTDSSVLEILVFNGVFIALWIGSGLLFWYASRQLQLKKNI